MPLTHRRAGELVRGLFRVLMPFPEGLPAKEALERLAAEVPPTEFESGTYPTTGKRRFEKIVRFRTITAVKAGWLVKNHGIWFLTDAGRQAYQEFENPKDFMLEAIRHYDDWAESRGLDEAVESEDDGVGSTEIQEESPEGPEIDAEGLAFRERAPTGSPPVFKKVDYTLSKLIQDIQMGEIALPDLQRPFVWPNTKIRDLLDSMYRGYPVGSLLFWTTVVPEGHRQIGHDQKQKYPSLLVVDGQQRLTSLYAVLTGTPVVREDWKPERVRIAFSPIHGRFEVANPAIQRDLEFIPDISVLWSKEVPRARFVREFVRKLRDRRQVSEDEEDRLAEVIDHVYDLQNYPFTALELSGTVGEEQVAEVFVRVNSLGTLLSQADFILTLMSVFWDKGRLALEGFSREAREPSVSGPSAFNYFIQPDPDQMLRVSVGLAFRRARLQNVYSVLRGKDMLTGEFSEERRTEQFQKLEEAQSYVLDLTNWHEFLKAVMEAGYRRGSMISSKMALIYTYLLYLIGKRDFGLDNRTLRWITSRWFFMVAITGRYTGSPETVMERDLNALENVENADGFVEHLNRIIGETLTTDYWNIGLVNQLATSSPIGPALSAFHAGQVLLGARVLLSNLSVSELLDPAIQGKKAAVERHHLFPRGFLAKQGLTRPRETNQIANMALVEWPDNISISDASPRDYWPKFSARFPAKELVEMMEVHGLFEGWHELSYQDFLEERRRRMAGVVRRAFDSLSRDPRTQRPVTESAEQDPELLSAESRRLSTEELARAGESAFVEFKESARWSHIKGEKEKTSEREVVRTLAGFLNGKGGTLLLGVNDQGYPVGLSRDFKSIQKRPNRDGFENWLTGVLRTALGGPAVSQLETNFVDIDGLDILRIDVEPAPEPVFVDDRQFFLRLNNTTQKLNLREMQGYIRSRWRSD